MCLWLKYLETLSSYLRKYIMGVKPMENSFALNTLQEHSMKDVAKL